MVGFASGQPVWIELADSENGTQFRGGGQDVDTGILARATDAERGFAATYDQNGKLQIWAIGKTDSSGKPIFRRIADRTVPGLRVARFSPNGDELVTGDVNGIVTWWNVPDLKLLVARCVSSRTVGGLDFTPDGMTMATSHFDGEILLWDTQTWEPQLSIRTEVSPLRDLRFDSSGQRLVAGGKSSQLLVFEAPRSAED
jgi:WD40 repeat protein